MSSDYANITEMDGQPGDAAFSAYNIMDMHRLGVGMSFLRRQKLPCEGDIAVNAIPAGEKAICIKADKEANRRLKP
jgi:hypothetical protein